MHRTSWRKIDTLTWFFGKLLGMLTFFSTLEKNCPAEERCYFCIFLTVREWENFATKCNKQPDEEHFSDLSIINAQLHVKP